MGRIIQEMTVLEAICRHRQKVDWPEVMVEAETGGYGLISTAEMTDRYRRDPQSLLLVDTRP